MVEADYWKQLERRLCREFEGMADNAIRFLWCDGFIPEEYRVDQTSPRIKGHVWIGNGSKQEQWEFTLFLKHPTSSIAKIDWSSLLPAENVTRWLAMDVAAKRAEILPAAAIENEEGKASINTFRDKTR